MSAVAPKARDGSGKRPGHRVVVIGAGWAGLAAALAAREAHADVVVVDGGLGASSLGPGVLDDVPWDDRERAARTLGASLIMRPDPASGGIATDLAWLASALGADRYAVAEVGAPLPIVATTAGRLRTASALDTALLDLARLSEGSKVLVPRVDRASWDADAIVRHLADDPHAIARSLSFTACEADVLRYDDERRIPDADLAARHDDDTRLQWLATQLRDTIARAGGAAAMLLGPWLGVAVPRAAQLGRTLGVAIGEAGVATAATAGLRFERAFALATARAGVRTVRGRATRVERRDGRAVVHLGSGDSLDADGVVLAVGGLGGGGIVFDPPEHGSGAEGAEAMRAPFRLSVACGVRVEARGDVGVAGSAFGPSFDEAAWPSGGVPGGLEVVGVRTDGDGRVGGEGVFAAGDVIVSRARTVGEAVASGRRAGRAAASS